MTFTHVHLHTQYSLLDGAIIIPDLIQYCKKTGMTACAITDHGWMAGIVEFYKECKAHDIKPLIGVEAYITENPDGLENEDKVRDNMHMVLLAKDNQGVELLMELVSNAALNNFYYKPRIWEGHLPQLAGHVVATTACLGGVIAKRVEFVQDQYGKALAVVETESANNAFKRYLKIFEDDLYLEVQCWDDEEHYQLVYNQFMKNLSKKHNVPLVLTADCHYLRENDTELHEVIMAMQFKKTLEDYRTTSDVQYGPHFFVAKPEEMLLRAKELETEEAYYNTQVIANKCNIELKLGEYQEPCFNIEEAPDYKEFQNWKEDFNAS